MKTPFCGKMIDEMPYCKKMADEMLIGLLYDAEELCFPDFEVCSDEETCNLTDSERCTEDCGYMELIHLNGRSSSPL